MKEEIKKFIELTKDNLEDNLGCGGWCIRCALANAMGKFGREEERTHWTEALKQLVNGYRAVSKVDFLMEETRDYLKSFGDKKMVFETKEEAIKFLDNSLK